MEFVVSLFFLFAFAALYFLPAIVAGQRDHPNARMIGVLNLFLGITVIGWIVLMVWSLLKK